MRLLCTFLVLASTTLLAPTMSLAQSLELPLTAAKLRTFVESRPGVTVEDLLAALPDTHKGDFVLMHTSRSLHRATPEQPRVIMFGSDARFLLAVSGVPEDPRYQLAEFAEFDAATGQYHFGTVDFAAQPRPVVSTDVPMCQGCHGNPTRPIWGEYPEWAGAYADNEAAIEAGLRSKFAAFAAGAAAAPRYRHLRFAAAADGSTFKLTSRLYPFANTNFNHELGNTVALGAITRLKASPEYRRWRKLLLGTSDMMECVRTDAWYGMTREIDRAYAAAGLPATRLPFVKVARLMGVDPTVEWSLESLARDAANGSAGRWQTGAFELTHAIAFLLVEDLPEAAQWFSDEDQVRTRRYIRERMQWVGEERARELTRSYAWFPFFDVFDPVVEDRRAHEAACEWLARPD